MRKYLYAQTAQETTPDGIFLPRRNYFMGQFMHALYPDYQLRFFRKSQVCWPAIIHTQPKVDGRLVHAPKNGMVAFEHYQDDSIKARLQKTDIYTDNECPKRKARHFGTSSLVFRPIHRFLKAYLLKGGFRDGLPGFIFACLEAYYQLIMVAKLCEQQKQLKVEEPTSKVSKIIVISKFTTQNAQTVSINHVALP